MKKIFPKHLNIGDEIRVIAPSSSLGIISEDTRKIADERFASLGLKLSFSNHVAELDEFNSSSIKSRVDDLHEAFLDKNVKAIITVIGGFNCNQLLGYINWPIIKKNPKILCGFSDITILNNAILTKTGLVSYSGPHYSTFGQELYFDYTLDYFKKCLMQDKEFYLETAPKWSDDRWYLDQERRTFFDNEGPYIIQKGKAIGELVGGNLSSLSLLFGTQYMPSLVNKIVCIEDDEEDTYKTIDRNFESLLQQPGVNMVKGIIIGRFQKSSGMSKEKIKRLISLRPQLKKIPVISQLDFGHTSPIATFPLGGIVSLNTLSKNFIVFKKF